MIVDALDINEARDVRLDKSGVTTAYFSLRKPVAINGKTIDGLKQIARREQMDIRICLHKDSESIFHNMILVQHSGNFHPPHKHPTKPECYHLIEGELGALHFDDEGNITKKCRLGVNNNFIYRIEANEYHVVFPISEWVVYHESKPGPFLRKEDFIEPEWAPDLDDEQAVRRYNQTIHEIFSQTDR